jgi:hypothetical protein
MNQALQDVIEHRRTTNVFEPNHTISDEQIEHLVHLATRAPTSFNLQNWRFLETGKNRGLSQLRIGCLLRPWLPRRQRRAPFLVQNMVSTWRRRQAPR